MARRVLCGFAHQTITNVQDAAEGQAYSTAGSPVIATSVLEAGDVWLRCNTTVQYAKWPSLGLATGHWFYARAAVMVNGNPTANSRLLHVLNGSVAEVGSIGLINAGSGTPPRLRLRDSAGATVGSDSANLVVNQRYVVEIGAFVPAAGSGELHFWLDGTLVASSVSASTTNSAVAELRVGTISGTPGNSVSVHFSDVAANDDSGASQTGRCGVEGRIFLLTPTATASNVGFIGGAGGAASPTAIDNLPPVGVAAGSATDSSQIKGPNGNTTDHYEATLQAYTARLQSSDLVTVIQPVVTVGTDDVFAIPAAVSTTANPADNTEASVNVPGAAIGTYPTNWRTIRGPVLYSPSVTLGSSPAVNVRRGNGGSPDYHVCFMGLYVEYQRRHELAGTSAGTSSASGDLTVSHPLAGSSAGAGTVSGDAGVAFALAGSSAGIGTASADLTVSHTLAGLSAGTGTASGDIGIAFALAGNSAGQGAATGTVGVGWSLAANSAGQGTASGDLVANRPLAGSLAGAADATGSLGVGWALSGTVVGAGTSTGDLTVAFILAGSSAGTSNATGDLGAGIFLQGTSAGTGTISGALSYGASLSGSVAGSSSATGDLPVSRSLQGQADGDSDASASVGVVYPLAGSSTGAGTASGDLSNVKVLVGSSAGAGTSSGVLIISRPLVGTSTGSGTVTGMLTGSWVLAGTSAGIGTASGSLSMIGPATPPPFADGALGRASLGGPTIKSEPGFARAGIK